jgi:hypothetical protein
MKEEKFNILIKGIQQDTSAEVVINNLSKLFKSDKSKFEALKNNRHLFVANDVE